MEGHRGLKNCVGRAGAARFEVVGTGRHLCIRRHVGEGQPREEHRSVLHRTIDRSEVRHDMKDSDLRLPWTWRREIVRIHPSLEVGNLSNGSHGVSLVRQKTGRGLECRRAIGRGPRRPHLEGVRPERQPEIVGDTFVRDVGEPLLAVDINIDRGGIGREMRHPDPGIA